MSLETFGAHAITFVVGVMVGAAGQYLADKYTDRRRKKETESDEDHRFRKLEEQMPDLFQAIRTDVQKEPSGLLRELFVLHSPGVTLGFAPPHFRYNESEIPNLRQKIDLLVNAGFVANITGTGAPKYRLAEHFVDRLRERK